MASKYAFKTKPTPEQKYALKRAIEVEKFGIFFQQRVGKTKVAIDFCGFKHLQRGDNKVLIISPLSVRSVWVDQIEEHLPDYIERYVNIYPDTEKKVDELLKASRNTTKLTFIIVNYDKLQAQQKKLMWWKPDIIIFDESHLIKHHNSKRSKASYSIACHCDRVLALTGTPITKSWTDIFGQFRAMNGDIFGTKWTDFKRKYAVMGGYMCKEIVGCTDLEDIKRKTKANSIRVLRKSVMNEPDVEEVVVKVPFEPSAKRAYEDLKRTWVTELDSGAVVAADMAMTRLMRLQQFCGGYAAIDGGGLQPVSKAKANVLRDLVTTHNAGGEPVVIFYRFRAEADLIWQTLKNSFVLGFYNGSMNEAEREQVKKDFQDGQLDAIVVQIGTGAMGVSFDIAHINIFYSMDYSYTNYAQAKDRVMGRFQKSDTVTNYYLAIENSVDLKIIKTLRNNEDFASNVVDSYKAILKGV